MFLTLRGGTRNFIWAPKNSWRGTLDGKLPKAISSRKPHGWMRNWVFNYTKVRAVGPATCLLVVEVRSLYVHKVYLTLSSYNYHHNRKNSHDLHGKHVQETTGGEEEKGKQTEPSPNTVLVSTRYTTCTVYVVR